MLGYAGLAAVLRAAVVRLSLVILSLLAALLVCSEARAEGNANVLLGVRALDGSFWSPVDDQFAVGVNVDWGRRESPVHWVVGLHFSQDTDYGPGTGWFGFLTTQVEAEGKLTEMSVGVDKIWKPADSILRPVIGGGISYVRARYEVVATGVNDDDATPGVYVHGGLFWATHAGSGPPSLNYGFDVRLVGGTDLELAGVSGDVDYAQIAFLMGIGW